MQTRNCRVCNIHRTPKGIQCRACTRGLKFATEAKGCDVAPSADVDPTREQRIAEYAARAARCEPVARKADAIPSA